MQRVLVRRPARAHASTPARARRARQAIALKNARDEASRDDGMRVLVDRLWPRGLTREQVAVDLWLKEAAPSDALRRWFGHDPERWESFERKYRLELDKRADLLQLLDELRQRDRLTLVYGAADAIRNNAVVLRKVLTERRFTPPEVARPMATRST